jgi:hypothetical protein
VATIKESDANLIGDFDVVNFFNIDCLLVILLAKQMDGFWIV